MVMAGTIIDEGASVSILSSIAWEELGSPPLLPEMRNLIGFDKGTSQPLGILTNVPIMLRRKTVHISIMVVEYPWIIIYSLDVTIFIAWEPVSPHSLQ